MIEIVNWKACWCAVPVALCLGARFAACDAVAAQPGTSSARMLWQTIDVLVEQIPFTKAKVESVLATQLVEKDSSRRAVPNTAFQFYVGGPVRLSDDIVIGNVDLRVRHEPGHPGFLVLNKLSGVCISFETVRAHYGNLKMIDYPRGGSAYETTAFSATLPWGKLSFGFLERNPDCLEGVSFAPDLMQADGPTK